MAECLFKAGVECHCKLKPIAEYAENLRDRTKLDQIIDLTSEVTSGEKDKLNMSEVESLHAKNQDQITQAVNVSENAQLVRQQGKNPNKCPYFNQENVIPRGRG